MEPIIAESARRHDVSDDTMLHAWRNPIVVHDPDDEGLIMIVGADTAGNLIEVGFVTSIDEITIVVHAMPYRDKFLRD